MNQEIKSYKDLVVWQKSIRMVKILYETTERFPREEVFGLTSQMRRAAVSIPSNIAEGRGRGTKKDYTNFLRISLGSVNELETQIEISKQFNKTKNLNYIELDNLLVEIQKMLKVMINKLNN